MQPVVNFINNIGNIGGLVGLGWAAWGAWDLAIGIRRELDDKKDKGIQSVILGAPWNGSENPLFRPCRRTVI